MIHLITGGQPPEDGARRNQLIPELRRPAEDRPDPKPGGASLNYTAPVDRSHATAREGAVFLGGEG